VAGPRRRADRRPRVRRPPVDRGAAGPGGPRLGARCLPGRNHGIGDHGGGRRGARVLEWIHRRCDDAISALDTPIGLLPTPGALNVDGLSIDTADLEELLRVDPHEWLQEIGPIRDFYAALGDSLPPELLRQLDALERRLLDAQRAETEARP
jgi:Phosphoenolpyruvate carboxykinase C-terminal P-loop domain